MSLTCSVELFTVLCSDTLQTMSIACSPLSLVFYLQFLQRENTQWYHSLQKKNSTCSTAYHSYIYIYTQSWSLLWLTSAHMIWVRCIFKVISKLLSPALPSAWKSCRETVFLSFACWFFFLSFFPPPSFTPRDFGEDVLVLLWWTKADFTSDSLILSLQIHSFMKKNFHYTTEITVFFFPLLF